MVRHLLWEQGHGGSSPLISTMENVEELADKYRKQLRLLPWDQFEKEQLNGWDLNTVLTEDARAYFKSIKRICGKTTKGLLLSIAEAIIENKPILLVHGDTRRKTKSLLNMAEDLIYRLELNLIVKGYSGKPFTSYSELNNG